MDENAQSFSPFYSQPESPKIYLPKPAGSASSGLTLVIPSLKSLKASQTANKTTSRSASHSHVFQDVELQERKIPRPVKLKPLKEVLSKLIAQLKKKDDYAFFLHPVDVAKVPGYSDIVKRPMDLGTMSDKVNRGKYRSLEDFASDFRLVTNNAKIFNPPGSIYHTEADRLEMWGLDHIGKAASMVIQYETDWNIEIEKDDDGPPVNVDEDDDDINAPTPMDVDTTSLRERSVSVASQVQQASGPSSRRGPRGPYKKLGQNAAPNALSETLEVDGGLPGSKDGIGAFPPGSDWAKTMVSLKLKGKRYKTKKERLRIEREGLPLLADGSLDYTEMEDPFSVLSFFVPDTLTRPHLVPLYPPLYNAPSYPTPPLPPPPQSVSEPSSSHMPQLPPVPSTYAPPTFPAATSVPLDHPSLTLPFLQPDSSGKQPRRRHWTIVRNATSRQKGKEREDEQEIAELPAWQMPREAHAVDFGSFSVLAGALAEEMRQPGMMPASSSSSTAVPEIDTVVQQQKDGSLSDQDVAFDLIRASLNCEIAAKNGGVVEDGKASATLLQVNLNGANLLASGYWTTQRAAEAEEYVRDLVYGGLGGLAYARSLAEFVDGNSYYKESDETPKRPYNPSLGMPLAKWIEENIIDPLTDGRHSLLRETAVELARQEGAIPQNPSVDPRQGTVASQVVASLHLYPAALVAMSALLHIRLHKIDMGSLIKTPNELFLSEEEWIGKSLKERRRSKLMKAKLEAESQASASVPLDDAMEVEEPEQTWAGVDASVKERINGRLSTYEQEGPEELNEVLEYVANVIIEMDRRNRVERNGNAKTSIPTTVNGTSEIHQTTSAEMTQDAAITKLEETSTGPSAPQSPSSPAPPAEDLLVRNLRLNLLALAKRAPLDTIARLPKDLVPEHIRHFVPTLGSTG